MFPRARAPLHRLAALVITTLAYAASTRPGSGADDVVLENPHVRYVISAEGVNRAFVDRASGTNLLRPGPPTTCASLRQGNRTVAASRLTRSGDTLELGFGDSGITAQLRLQATEHALVLDLVGVRGGNPDSLTFLDVPLTLTGRPEEITGACALALNLRTRVDALPALQSHLQATAMAKFGLPGARVAIVAGPMSQLLLHLRETLASASELPVCRLAGPWAQDVPFNHGSYLFNFGTLSSTNLDEWITMTRSLGFTQIDNHGGGSFFRFGDLVLDAKKWPGGWADWKGIVDRLHTAGVGSILHTYAFFIDKRSKYVTPVPDPRLDAFRSFTLAAPLAAADREATVTESTADIRTVTGFFEHNSTLLQLGDELVSFTGVSKSPPWRFTGLERGALGTRAAHHPAGTAARHLKECFGLLVPNPESTLFEEIAANHARVVDDCGFDGLYLDAIDGSSILRGNDECWYWANKFVVDIQKHLRRPVGMEMSAMWHHFWQYRTRWQAWDYPQRGHVDFVDRHIQGIHGGLLLPLHLGWWGFQSFDAPQIEPTYPEVMETLAARLVGWDAGISLTAGVDRKALAQTPLFQRAVEILRTGEELRHSGRVDPAIRARLREPGREFALVRPPTGDPRFRPQTSHARRVSPAEPWTLAWSVTNTFAPQPLRFRIEALMSTDSHASTAAPDTNAMVLLDLAQVAEARPPTTPTQATGVTVNLESTADVANAPARLGPWIHVRATDGHPRRAGWARWERRFDPPLDLKTRQGLALELDGDGSGALVAVRLESPQAIAFGAVADRYLPVDFTGRRVVTLVETESSRWHDYTWNDAKGLYNLHRETIHFDQVESVSLWIHNVDATHPARVRLGPVRAVPLRAIPLKNPRLTVAGQTVEFPFELPAGGWIEGSGPDDCAAFDAKGRRLGPIIPRGAWPSSPAGISPISFACEPTPGGPSRARIVVFHQGDPL